MVLLARFAGLSILILFGCALEGYLNGPERWIMKYDFSGAPVVFVSKTGFLAFFTLFLAITNGTVFFARRFLGANLQMDYINIPHKDHWVKPENAGQGLRRFHALLDAVLVFVNGVALLIYILARFAFTGAVVNVLLSGALLAVIFLLTASYKLFVPPKS